MSDSLQRRLLERELELMTYFALGIASDLGGGQEPADARILARTLLSVALKLSRLLWPHGRRAGDELALAEATELREELGLSPESALSPERTPPLATALRLDDEAFGRAFDASTLTIRTETLELPLRPTVEAIRQVQEGVARRGGA